MSRFLIVWLVFSLKKVTDLMSGSATKLNSQALACLRALLRHTKGTLILTSSHALCRLGILGRDYRNRSKVASQNYRCLTNNSEPIDAVWIAVRRFLLEEGATWGQNKQIISQIQACTRQLDEVVAPLHQQKIPVILAPLHMVSDVLATIVGAGTTPRNATVIASSSAEQNKFDSDSRILGGINLSYCTIHQEEKSLARELMTLMAEIGSGTKNMIIFPDITPDFTIHAGEGAINKLPCRLFNRPAKLHSGIVRLSSVISAQVVFYNLYYKNGIRINIHTPISAKEITTQMPIIIENAIRDYPNDWLLWHSHSLYFINH
ncbi:ABC transporter [Providencia sp.]